MVNILIVNMYLLYKISGVDFGTLDLTYLLFTSVRFWAGLPFLLSPPECASVREQ